jgi:hypothetical protein
MGFTVLYMFKPKPRYVSWTISIIFRMIYRCNHQFLAMGLTVLIGY